MSSRGNRPENRARLTRHFDGDGAGLIAVVAVGESVGRGWETVSASSGGSVPASQWSETTAARMAASVTAGIRQDRLAPVLAALGNAHRIRLLGKLLEGPATYQAMRKATSLKVGPLYYHINQLRLAGLIGPKRRNLYELTRGGRNLVMVAWTLPKLVNDRRLRPQPGSTERPRPAPDDLRRAAGGR